MRTILILLLASSTSVLIAQSKQFKSPVSYSYKPTKTKVTIERDVTISKDAITITKLWNGETEDAKFKIERIEKKPYFLDDSTWYYCIDTKENISIEDPDKRVYRKTIVIVPESIEGTSPNGLINVFSFANEVTVYHYVLGVY
jgi:intein-encoded DNA endonuclease-like protein